MCQLQTLAIQQINASIVNKQALLINSQNGKLDEQWYLSSRFQMWVKKGDFFIVFSCTTTVFYTATVSCPYICNKLPSMLEMMNNNQTQRPVFKHGGSYLLVLLDVCK